MVVIGKISARGTGRKDWSDLVELGVIPTVRSHQYRDTWTGTFEDEEIGPGEGVAYALVTPTAIFRGLTLQMRQFECSFDINTLTEFRIIWMDLDLCLLGYPADEITLKTYSKGYGYGGFEWIIPKGISVDIPEDAKASILYPYYLKECFGTLLYNRTDQTITVDVTGFNSGFDSELAK